MPTSTPGPSACTSDRPTRRRWSAAAPTAWRAKVAAWRAIRSNGVIRLFCRHSRESGNPVGGPGSPLARRAVRGMSHCVADGCPVEPARTGYLLVVETQEGPGMQHCNSIFASLLKPIPRRWFKAAVERHGGGGYDKSFRSREHLVTLIFLPPFACG